MAKKLRSALTVAAASVGFVVALGASLVGPAEATVELPAQRGDEGQDCAGGEIHDGGEYDGEAAGDFVYQNDFRVVERFTPIGYPFQYSAVCVALHAGGPSINLDLRVQVYDDDGPDGTPGTLLAEMPVSTGVLPWAPPSPIWQFYRFDIDQLGIVVSSGSVYLGVAWNPQQEGYVGVLLDHIPGLLLPGNYYWDEWEGTWLPLQVFEGDPSAFFIRALGAGLASDIPAMGATGLVALSFLLLGLAIRAIWRREHGRRSSAT